MKNTILAATAVGAVLATPLAAENRIDGQASNAPDLSAYGPYDIGVRQFDFVNPNQVDVVTLGTAPPADGSTPTYDRPLTVEMWYPALNGSTGDTSLEAYIRDGVTEVSLEGRAVRDAAVSDAATDLPLVLLSHGYPGNRFLMYHLAENLASKGYVVASIDHTDSTYRTQSVFGSTLRNRPLDQLFVLDEIERINNDPTSPFAGLIDTDNTALIGYSMGGYGALVTAGAGLSQGFIDLAEGFSLAPPDVLDIHLEGSETHEAQPDERIKTAVTIGPWGRQFGAWSDTALANIDIPLLVIAGSNDEVAGVEGVGYGPGPRSIWEAAINSDRSLLTFDGAGHNAAAPIPAPEESFYFNDALGFNVSEHYTDPVWDTVFMNNVAQHFTTAWLDRALKGDEDKAAYFDLTSNGTGADWFGFEPCASDGLLFESLAAVPLPASVWLLVAALGGIAVARRKRA